MARLTIQTERAALDIVSTRAKLTITTPKRSFRIRSTPPRMEITRVSPKFTVDWASVHAQRGHADPETYRVQEAQRVAAELTSHIGDIAGDGSRIGRLNEYTGTKGAVYGDIARDRARHSLPKINVAGAGTPPKIQWSEGRLEVSWKIGSMEIEWDDQCSPEITYTPYSVEIRLSEYGSVRIGVIEDKVPKTAGNRLNVKM